MADDDLKAAAPLTEDQVEAIRKRLANADPTELNKIFNTQTQVINATLQMAIKQTDEEDEIVELEHVKRIINMAPADELFIRSKDKIWAVRKHILNKDATFFLNKDYKSLIKKDKNQSMIETLVSIIKERYVALSHEDQEQYWLKGIKLLQLVASYKKLVGEP
jgi:hypothetical protein